jgi:hypothetical protein
MRLAFVLAVLAASACSSPTEGNGWLFGDPLPVQGSAVKGTGGPATVTPGAGKITVAGTYTYAVGCYLAFTFESRMVGARVLLRVSAGSSDSVCTEDVTDWTYQATIDGLPPGTYTVEVQSDDTFSNRVAWRTVTTETVVVP